MSGEELLLAQTAKTGLESLIFRYLELAGELPDEILNKKAKDVTSYRQNRGKRWTKVRSGNLASLLRKNTAAWLVALKLGRSEVAVRRKASELHLSIRPN